jgi:hypothetical protein
MRIDGESNIPHGPGHLCNGARRSSMTKMKWIATAALTTALAAPAGWTTAYAAVLHQPAMTAAMGQRGWDQPPDEYREVQRQGFHDGMEAARRDWGRHRHRDADDHSRYRRPPVPRELSNDYRDGFRHGYDAAMHHMRDEHRDRDHDRD